MVEKLDSGKDGINTLSLIRHIAVQNKILGVQQETLYGPFGERALQRHL